MSDGTLAALGWTDELEAASTPYRERGFRPARVVAEHRGGYYVRSELGDRLAHARGRMRDDEIWGGMPAVGDWVVVCDAPGDRDAIEALLPAPNEGLPQDAVAEGRGAHPRRERRHGRPRQRPRRGLQSAAPRALPHRGLGQRGGPGDRAHEARRLRRPGQARRGRGGRRRRSRAARSATSRARGSTPFGRCCSPRRRSSSSGRRARGSRHWPTGSPGAP